MISPLLPSYWPWVGLLEQRLLVDFSSDGWKPGNYRQILEHRNSGELAALHMPPTCRYRPTPLRHKPRLELAPFLCTWIATPDALTAWTLSLMSRTPGRVFVPAPRKCTPVSDRLHLRGHPSPLAGETNPHPRLTVLTHETARGSLHQ